MNNKSKYKKKRYIIGWIWIIVGVLLLFCIHAANDHPGYKVAVNRLVMIYICVSPVLAGIVSYIKRKENNSK